MEIDFSTLFRVVVFDDVVPAAQGQENEVLQKPSPRGVKLGGRRSRQTGVDEIVLVGIHSADGCGIGPERDAVHKVRLLQPVEVV